jgi:acrylyl-CoA reductase (NADPH)
MFNAILLQRAADKSTLAELQPMGDERLPDRAVTVDVEWSTINFKDALALTGRGPVVRQWPLVPGIDLAGTVSASADPRWTPGQRVVVTGWGLGESHWGGLSQRARVDADWVLALPESMSTRDAMAIGTAGFTAALCVLALQQHGVTPGDGEVLVTGSAGGVGSIAIALLGSLGYRVIASTGRPQEADYLHALGAADILDRNTLMAPGKPLQAERWAGVVDTVGSHTLANACAQTRQYGTVAACGLAQGGDFTSTVMPFILRGVTLAGINSVLTPNALRTQAWALLAEHVSRERLARMTHEIGLSEAIAYAPRVLDGQVRGRTVVNTAR